MAEQHVKRVQDRLLVCILVTVAIVPQKLTFAQPRQHTPLQSK